MACVRLSRISAPESWPLTFARTPIDRLERFNVLYNILSRATLSLAIRLLSLRLSSETKKVRFEDEKRRRRRRRDRTRRPVPSLRATKNTRTNGLAHTESSSFSRLLAACCPRPSSPRAPANAPVYTLYLE